MFLLVAAIAALAIVRPIAWLHLQTRRRARRVLLVAVALAVVMLLWPASETRVATIVSRLDSIVPVYQFSEFHDTTINAPAGRTYRAICAVTSDEIVLLHTLTWIRRFGRPGPPGVLNPPGRQPFCEVALRSGFYRLADDPGQEMVLGTFLAAPEAARSHPPEAITATTFAGVRAPGFGIVVMNFRLQPLAHNRTLLSTETRVFATDITTRRLFTPYWRLIYPGSAIIRASWLRAIKRRAEATN